MGGVLEFEGKEGAYVVVARHVEGAAVWPTQLPLLIKTSSMAKSPVKDVPAIPSNVSFKETRIFNQKLKM